MPTYSYACPKCGRIEDVFHSIKASPRVKCKKCGSACKRKLGVGAGIIFKGSGFYETDYKRAGSKSSGEAKAEAASKSEGAESKGESKEVATKSEGKSAESKSEKSDAKPAAASKASTAPQADSGGRKSASKSAKKTGRGR